MMFPLTPRKKLVGGAMLVASFLSPVAAEEVKTAPAATNEAQSVGKAADGEELYYWVTDGKGTVPVNTPCVFPYKFQGKEYNNCILTAEMSQYGWCGATANVDESGLWGGCKKGSETQANKVLVPTCPGGTFLNPLDDLCHYCSPGTFGEGGNKFCTVCPKGKASRSPGSTFCGRCALGEFADKDGMDTCLKCPPDTYQSETGSSGCIPCAAGEHAPQGSISCSPATTATATTKPATPLAPATPSAAPEDEEEGYDGAEEVYEEVDDAQEQTEQDAAGKADQEKPARSAACVACVATKDAFCVGGAAWDDLCDKKAEEECPLVCGVQASPEPQTLVPKLPSSTCVACVGKVDGWCTGGASWDSQCDKHAVTSCPLQCSSLPAPSPACVMCVMTQDVWCKGGANWDAQCSKKAETFCSTQCASSAGSSSGALPAPAVTAPCVSCVKVVDSWCIGGAQWDKTCGVIASTAKCQAFCSSLSDEIAKAASAASALTGVQAGGKSAPCIACVHASDAWCSKSTWDSKCEQMATGFACSSMCGATLTTGGVAADGVYYSPSTQCAGCVSGVDQFCEGATPQGMAWDGVCQQVADSQCKASC